MSLIPGQSGHPPQVFLKGKTGEGLPSLYMVLCVRGHLPGTLCVLGCLPCLLLNLLLSA